MWLPSPSSPHGGAAAGSLYSTVQYMYAVLVCIVCVHTYIHVHENRVEQSTVEYLLYSRREGIVPSPTLV